MTTIRKSAWAEARATVKMWHQSAQYWCTAAGKAQAELRAAHARIAELEAALASARDDAATKGRAPH